MGWFIFGVVVLLGIVAAFRIFGRTPGQQPPATRVAASPDELRQRDTYTLTRVELDVVLAADLADDERHAPTGGSIHRSEYLSPEDEARHVTLDNGMPNIRLVRKRGQLVMVVPKGMVNFRSRALPRMDIYAFRARGVTHYEEAVMAASLSPGTKLRLVREPTNEFDTNAIAIYSDRGVGPLGYVNRQNAARLAKALDAGQSFAAITLSGSPAGRDGDPFTILVARPDVITHMRAKP